VRLRDATERDIPGVLALINEYAQENLVLARTEESLRACLADFAVAEVDGDIVGCSALSELGPGLGEIRSLAVRASMNGRGIGRRIIEYHMEQAYGRGFVEVLALTRRVSLFEKLGFHITRRERFLDKLAADCKACPLSLCCDEIAVHWIPPGALVAARELAGNTSEGAHPDSGDGRGGAVGTGGGGGTGRAAATTEKPPLFASLLPT
jgi:N-acetylglutamate synthase-like GNAT family acetyltransferase